MSNVASSVGYIQMDLLCDCLFNFFCFCKQNESLYELHLLTYLNPTALRTAKTQRSFGCSECNRVNGVLAILSAIELRCQWIPLLHLYESTWRYCYHPDIDVGISIGVDVGVGITLQSFTTKFFYVMVKAL